LPNHKVRGITKKYNGRHLLVILVLLWPIGTIQAESLAERYFRPPIAAELLSPQGDLLLSVMKDGNTSRVLATDIEAKQQKEVYSTAGSKNMGDSISDLQWIDGRSLVVTIIQKRQGIADIADTREVTKNLIFILPDNLEKGEIEAREIKTRGTVIATIPAQKHMVLFARSGDVSRVYRIDINQTALVGEPVSKTTQIDGGQFTKNNEVASIDGFALRWLADAAGVIHAVTTIGANGHFSLWYRSANDTPWIVLKTFESSDTKKDLANEADLNEFSKVLPLALGDEEKTFYIVETNADETKELYKYNYDTGAKQPVYKEAIGEIVRPQFDYTGHRLLGAVIRRGSEIYFDYLDNESREIQSRLKKRLSKNIVITGIDLTHRYYSILARDAESYGMLYRYEPSTDVLVPIHNIAPWLEGLRASQVELGLVSNAGLDVEYLLMRPAGKAKAPLVVIPHGGPIGVEDDRNFDPAAQFLVAQGFAVLKVNYRGSAGYGVSFLKAGKKEFGDKILSDIEAAVQQVVAQGFVDAGHQCIVGGSYGGYAALMLAIRSPQKYRCAASLAGVTDVNLLFERNLAPKTKEFLIDYIGDPAMSSDYFKSISPVYLARELKIPVYLAQGDEDLRVDPEHAYRMKAMLDIYHKKYEWDILKGEAHGFNDYLSAASYYEKLAKFLKNNI